LVNTSSVVLTRVIETIVYVHLTVQPRISIDARAGKAIDSIMTGCVVEARLDRTLVYLKFTVFPVVASAAFTLETSDLVNADTILRTVGIFTVINCLLAM